MKLCFARRWTNAPQLDDDEALITGGGENAFIAGQLAFGSSRHTHHLDVTRIVKKHGKRGITFAFVRETRHSGDDEDKGRQVVIGSIESDTGPTLHFWY